MKSHSARLAIFGLVVILAIPVWANAQVINACYNARNGDLRRVDDPSECRTGEIPLSWDIEGPQGPAGPQGPEGGFDLSRVYTKVCNNLLDCLCDGEGDVIVSGAVSCGAFKYPMYSSKSFYGEGWYGLCKDLMDDSEMPPYVITIICIEP